VNEPHLNFGDRDVGIENDMNDESIMFVLSGSHVSDNAMLCPAIMRGSLGNMYRQRREIIEDVVAWMRADDEWEEIEELDE